MEAGFHAGMDEIVVTSSWRERLERLRGSRKESWALVAVLGIAILGALALWMRGAPAVIAPPAEASTEEAQAAGTLGAATPGPTGVVLVHVAGAVRRPGLYELPAGARVADAIDSAGGPIRVADLDPINLAQVVADAMKVEVPRRGEAVTAPPLPGMTPGVSAGGAAAVGAVSLNSADLTALESIPGIGPVKAGAILQYRDEVGGFSSVEELIDVTGIGPATLESIRPYVTL
ncbi:MAG: helix-hairpin-helix domain-containing protein [Actinomycetota bacterium]